MHDEDATELYDALENKVPILSKDHDNHTIYEYKITLKSDPEHAIENVSLTLSQSAFNGGNGIYKNYETQSGIAKPTIRRDHDSMTEKNTTTWFYFKYAEQPLLVGITPEIVLNKDDVKESKIVLDEQYKIHHKESWFGGIMNSLF